MTCPLPDCEAPRCAGATWCARSATPENVKAFLAQVLHRMKGGRPFGKACAETYATAMAKTETGCLFQ